LKSPEPHELRQPDEALDSHDSHESDEDAARRHGEDHQDEGHSEPWLISYADLMTLLVGFFVILFAFASENTLKETPGMIMVRQELAKYFGLPAKKTEDPGPTQGPSAETTASGELDSRTKLRVAQLIEELREKRIIESAEIVPKPYGFDLNFKSAVLFESGSARLFEGIEKELRSLGARLALEPTRPRVMVEGHTDDVPLRRTPIYPSNWELSSARAGAVVRILEEAGYPEVNLAAVGLGASMPAQPNRDATGKPIPENQAANRRVTLRVFFSAPGDASGLVTTPPAGPEPAGPPPPSNLSEPEANTAQKAESQSPGGD
jgi:chemotaxis protein MotB